MPTRPPLPEPPGEDPLTLFAEWIEHARRAGQAEPEAMALATAGADGRSAVRFVLLRGFDRRGFVFYTNRNSRKGIDIRATGWASAAFRWQATDRQVRLTGPVEPVDDAQSDAYFAGRPRQSQLGAWASEQSAPIGSRADLERLFADAASRYRDRPVPRPPWWGGYRIEPQQFEFWQQGQHRLHDRFLYRLEEGGSWSVTRLAP